MSHVKVFDVGLSDQLKKYFGFDHFRGVQEEVLQRMAEGESLLCLMPTGTGKSLCYQFPAVVNPGLVLVISPLIALMQDQTDKAQKMGIAAAHLSSAQSREERDKVLGRLAENKLKLLFVTPERFRKNDFVAAIQAMLNKGGEIQLLAFDEAHCISQWGHDFRPDYGKVGEIRQRLGNPLTLALTATATPEVQKDILLKIGLCNQKDIDKDLWSEAVISAGLERPNLRVQVHSVYGIEDKVRQLVGLSHQIVGAKIVYVSLIQTLKKVSAELRKLGIEHLVYHGDLDSGARRRSLRDFQSQESPLMLATPAFGLGIDKQNVRAVVHLETPGSLESYFQEIGRAGRDGLDSYCHLLYDEDDISIQMEFLKWSHPEDSFVVKVFDLIEANRLRLDAEGFDFLREQMSFKNRRDFRVEAAVNILERLGCLARSEDRFPFKVIERPSMELLKEENAELQLKNQNSKLLEMVRYASMDEGCRLQKIYSYFGHQADICGQCDLCLNPVPKDSDDD